MTAGLSLEVRPSATYVDVIDTIDGHKVVRVDLAASRLVTFTVAEIDLGDRQAAILALEALREAGIFGPGFRVLRFSNVGPVGGTASDHAETVARHDAICNVVKAFLKRSTKRVANAYLTPNGSTLETLIFLK
ncbi:hypothetical protein [Tropicimonas isoalkanivorans]|uniref:Uncharacterized protein n=1 Tax=Tropicimonas isoalkanivorans TaxID=441112 RepID=A0A1I1N0B1_9RHOB|nr:hypothetical protein [Tropicimonas isoalkanivorans]SFC87240.1 hypothetical protein SAMN04488094_110139 [Tropicimonas isoalkanivorans]